AAGVGEEDIDAALLLLHRCVQAIEVREIGDVAPNAGSPLAELHHPALELGLAPAGDEDVGALVGEPLCGGEADAAAATRDDGDFPFESIHERRSFVVGALGVFGTSTATRLPSLSPSGGLVMSRSLPLRPETISTD